ncbi:uncharacterized protein LOC119176045 isoform X4 [Rhipicephalus microplus]|uniref:uncharacterized protein LOC119176045 isoform X4 n=1 Tax=Rhipicephalus microplus TaxID=6941 RepID=UPI003F6C6B42
MLVSRLVFLAQCKVKAGGMRITQHKPAGSTHEKAPELKKDDGEDVVEEVSPSDHEFTEERKGPKFSLEVGGKIGVKLSICKVTCVPSH